MDVIQSEEGMLHVLLCINERNGPCCKPFMTLDDVKAIKMWIRAHGIRAQCTATRCLGYCNRNGAVAKVMPDGTIYTGITSQEDIHTIIKKHLGDK